MAGFLPSKELAQERRRNCKPLFIALSGCITGLIYPIFAFRHRNREILFYYLGITAFIVLFREFFEPLDYAYNLVTGIAYRIFNFFIFTKYGPFLLHFTSIYLITLDSKQKAKLSFLRPFINENDAFPLKIRKTTSILKIIFKINDDKAKEIYQETKDFAEGREPTIENLNHILMVSHNLEPVQFCKKDGLKIIPEKLRANLEKKPDNKKKVSSKKTKATVKQKQSSSFSESIQSIFTYGVGGLIGVFVIRVAKEILSN